MFEVRPARFLDAVSLAPRLRLEDAREIRLVWSVGSLEGLCYCLVNSDRAFTLCAGGQPVALWGVSVARASGLELGVPWMLASRALFQQRRDLIRQSRIWVDRVLMDVDVLVNVTDSTNTAHLRWLAWCGFRPLRVHPQFGPFRRPFQEFCRVNERRHAEDGAMRSLLLRRPAPKPLTVPDELQRMLAALAGALAPGSGLPAWLAHPGAVETTAWPRRWRRNVHALLVEVARRSTRGAAARHDHDDVWQCAAALADTAEVARFDGGDPADLLVELSACIARPPGGYASAPENAYLSPAGSRTWPAPVARLLEGFLYALTLGGRVSPIQGSRLWGAALQVDAAEPVWGLERPALHRAFREHHLAAPWRRSMAGGNARPPGRTLEGLHGACADWPGLRSVLQAMLDEQPPGLSETSVPADLTAVAGSVADALARRVWPLPRLGPVSVGYVERHALYRLLRVHLLRVMGVGETTIACLVIDELSGLLAVAAFEDALLTVPDRCAGGDWTIALGAAVRAMWPETGESDGARLLALLLPALVCPTLATAQLPGALLAFHLEAIAATDDVLQRVSVVLAKQQHERRRRVAGCLREAARGLDMVTVQRHLDGHARRIASAATGPSPLESP